MVWVSGWEGGVVWMSGWEDGVVWVSGWEDGVAWIVMTGGSGMESDDWMEWYG